MNRQPPHHSDGLDKAMRDAIIAASRCGFDGKVRIRNTPDAIKNIAMVGARVEHDMAKPFELALIDDLYRDDSGRLQRTIMALSEAGIPFHPECKLWIYNFDLKSDFLSAAIIEAEDSRRELHPVDMDLVISCFILNQHRLGIELKSDAHTEGDVHGYGFGRAHPRSMSPLAKESNIWMRAALALNARFIATYGSTSEVGPAEFEHEGGYIEVTPAEKRPKGYMDLALRYLIRRDIMEALPGFVCSRDITDPETFQIG